MTPNNQTILVVGGAGYIGSHLVKLLESTQHTAIVFDNLSTGHRDATPHAKFILGDLSDSQALNDCFENNCIDVVMHFASSIVVGESVKDPAKYYRNNVINTICLLDAMRAHRVNKIIFSSTAAVYGNPISTPISIHHPRNPVNPYGKSKAMVEQIIEDYGRAYKMQHVFLRYFNAAGAHPDGSLCEKHDPETHLIPLALQVALGDKKELSVFGNDYDTPDGTCIRDYVHVCDIAKAHLLAMDYLNTQPQSACFNLGTHTGHSVKEVIALIESVTQKKLKIKWDTRRAGDPPILVADATETKKILQWKADYTLKDMIQSAFYSLHAASNPATDSAKPHCEII